MSAKGNKSDYLILVTLGIVSAAVIFALTAWGWLRQDDDDGPFVRTTRSTNVQGTMVCYVLFERLGVPVRRFDRPPLSDDLKQIDILFLIDPILPIQTSEVVELKQWIHGGGVLICSDGVAALLGLLSRTDDGTYRGFSTGRVLFTKKSVRTTVPGDSPVLALARDVRSVHLATLSTLEINDIDPMDQMGAAEPLLSDVVGCRLLTRTVGAGRTIVLADSSFLANGWIGKADNAILAANLAAYSLSEARGKRVAFDEYHFGYGAHQTRWTTMSGMLFRTSAGWAVLSATAAGLCFLVYKGRRFGTRRAPQRVRRRSKLEYILSVGATYRAVGANQLTLRLIFTWLKGKGARLIGLPESSPVEDIAKRLAQRTGGRPDRYEKAFQRCQEALGGRRLSGRRLASLLSELSMIESEIGDGRSAGK